LGGGSVFGLYVAKDAITNLKIVDNLFLLADIHFAGLVSTAPPRILRGCSDNRFIFPALINQFICPINIGHPQVLTRFVGGHNPVCNARGSKIHLV